MAEYTATPKYYKTVRPYMNGAKATICEATDGMDYHVKDKAFTAWFGDTESAFIKADEWADEQLRILNIWAVCEHPDRVSEHSDKFTQWVRATHRTKA